LILKGADGGQASRADISYATKSTLSRYLE